ncbi:MAG: A24 family peptidase [Intrasporangium sp.]|uniref:prepilin peptidase n=1 Tax=Intrasporangium sp. TaxID=1925024 RepID=UPI002649F4A1|nr:A24 family peptidase [Intrasporangium sp.]MDN5795026.1 A24 family peptidase [Intrasporangium sp.]
MPAPVAYALLVIAGVVAGLVIESRLRQRSYRLDEERSFPTRFTAWVAPVTGVLTAATWWATSPGMPVLVPVVYLASTWVMVVLAVIDLDVHRLPDRIQLPAYPVLLVLLALCSWSTDGWDDLLRAVLAGLALFAAYFVLVLVAPGGGMGLGDAKLSGLLGLLLGWLSWAHVIFATLTTFLLGGVVAVTLLIVQRAGRRTEFAYGPVMLASAAVTVVVLSGPFIDLVR